MLEIGETVERYRIEAVLGTGMQATVYRVRHLQLGTEHALKVLTATSPSDRARLFAEGQIQAKLRHPNVVGVTDVLLVNRIPALVLELVEGPSLQKLLADSDGRIHIEDALELFRDIVTGIGVAHAAGLVHRDLKPSNVLLGLGRSGGWLAKVTDFGLGRVPGAESPLTRTGTAIGTPAYTSPEQIRNPSTVDARADLWALGCVLYELVSGTRAFPDTDPLVLFEMVASARYVDLGSELMPVAPVRVTDVIRDLLRSDPNARIVSCAHLWERLWDDPAPDELHRGERVVLEVPVALEPPVPVPPLDATPRVDLTALEDVGLEAPPTLIPFDEEITFVGEVRADPIESASAAPSTPPGLLLVPPYAMAPVRVEPPSMPEPPPVAGRDRALWAWPLALGVAVLAAVPLGLLLFGLASLAVPARPPDPVASVVVAPPPKVPSPAPIVAPEPEPAPRPAPEPEPQPVRTPAPVPIAPVAAHPTSTGTVSIEGDATEVWLDAGGTRVDVGGRIPSGSYVVRASFGDGVPRHAGEIQVRAGTETRVRCAAFVYACTEVHR